MNILFFLLWRASLSPNPDVSPYGGGDETASLTGRHGSDGARALVLSVVERHPYKAEKLLEDILGICS